MTDSDLLRQILDTGDQRRAERRRFLRTAANASIAAGGLAMLAACGGDDSDPTPTPSPTPTPTPTATATGTPVYADYEILNFALNLEYLEAQFYAFAANGAGLAAALLTGSGTAGAVTGGAQVTFSDPLVAQYAREIAADELAHVTFLRGLLGTAVVAQPAINISGDANGAFTAAARAAGVVGPTDVFNPYANDENFLLGAFLFEDVGVTAYKGASTLLASKTYIEVAAGILAAECYHAGLIRTVLYQKGIATPALRVNAGKISDARDTLDGAASDLDQGITGDSTTSNIVPTNANGLAFGRSAAQVLNIVYLNGAAVGTGGFFPAGVNGTIKTSAANV